MHGIRPIVGGFDAAAGAALRLRRPQLGHSDYRHNQLYIVPNFAVGAYKEGSDKKLGGPLEFPLERIEIDYRFPPTPSRSA